MSTLSDIFAADDADQAPADTAQPAADDAAVAPGTPGYDPDTDDKPPEMLLPGGSDDPAA